MAFAKGHNPHHPEKNTETRVEPIRDARAIEIIKAQLAGKPRDRCLFTLGINTAFRANELLSITLGQVQDLNAGDALRVRQTKTAIARFPGKLHGFPETLYAYMMRAFSYVDLLSSYWAGSSNAHQTKRMVDFMDRYMRYEREAHSFAIRESRAQIEAHEFGERHSCMRKAVGIDRHAGEFDLAL